MCQFFFSFFHLIAQLFCSVFLRPFMKVAALPNPLPACITKNNSPCIFILAKPYAADKEALIQCLKTLSIKPGQIITLPHAQTTSGHTAANTFQQQLATVYAKNPEIQIIPVNVFWGRSPRKVKTVMQATLANSWSVPGRLRRGLFLLMQLRQVSCYFGQAIDLQNRINSADPKSLLDELNLRFNQQKEAVIGPDLSHQRMLSTQILQSNIVKDCIDQLHKEGNEDKNKLEKKAQKYLKEMASDYSYSVVRIFDILLSWLWEKLYQGVEVRGMENVQAVAADHELVYVPCHRSHMDYLLLSYVIFHKGLMPPHIAAGINLNLPIVGSLLRRGGAFFIRRQFRDNKLYRAVLESYVACMCQQGFSMEYFIEGGRSRTGFLLQPKPGMLAMTLRAAQDQSDKPLAFLPVYIAYERLMESHSYINELYGEKKEKESLSSLLSARHYLKEDYGKVFMSIGKPIFAEKIWQKVGVTTSPKPKDGELFFNCVDQLSQSIQTEINNTAYLSPLNLIATALLSSKRRALPESQLLLQLQLLSACLDLPVFRDSLQLHAFEPQAAIEHALKLNVIQKNANALGHIFYLNQQAQVGATFLRNNTLHVFILPAMVASILTQGKPVSGKRLLAICLRLYPYLKSELFLPWQIEDLEAVVEDILQHFLSLKLIKQDGKTYYCASEETETFQALTILSGACKGSIERFYITAELLTSSAKGFYNRSTLELACTQMAERLSLLHEFHAPDFFDKNLFRTFIASLIKEGLLIEDENQNLQYQRALLTAKKLGKYVLSPSVKRSIQQVTQPSV